MGNKFIGAQISIHKMYKIITEGINLNALLLKYIVFDQTIVFHGSQIEKINIDHEM